MPLFGTFIIQCWFTAKSSILNHNPYSGVFREDTTSLEFSVLRTRWEAHSWSVCTCKPSYIKWCNVMPNVKHLVYRLRPNHFYFIKYTCFTKTKLFHVDLFECLVGTRGGRRETVIQKHKEIVHKRKNTLSETATQFGFHTEPSHSKIINAAAHMSLAATR